MKTRPGICQRKKRFATREDAERVAAKAPFNCVPTNASFAANITSPAAPRG